jgi:hypothetical protein
MTEHDGHIFAVAMNSVAELLRRSGNPFNLYLVFSEEKGWRAALGGQAPSALDDPKVEWSKSPAVAVQKIAGLLEQVYKQNEKTESRRDAARRRRT